MKTKQVFAPIILTIGSVIAFSIFLFKKDFFFSKIITISNGSTKSGQQNLDQNSTQVEFQKLSILPNRCRGCGKCVRIDPSHFSINDQTAIVVSSTNLNSSSLRLAINNCPSQAITLQ